MAKKKDMWKHIAIVLGKGKRTVEVWFCELTDKFYLNGSETELALNFNKIPFKAKWAGIGQHLCECYEKMEKTMVAQLMCDHKFNPYGMGFMCKKCKFYTGTNSDLNKQIQEVQKNESRSKKK